MVVEKVNLSTPCLNEAFGIIEPLRILYYLLAFIYVPN
jgi:hypothetical protein